MSGRDEDVRSLDSADREGLRLDADPLDPLAADALVPAAPAAQLGHVVEELARPSGCTGRRGCASSGAAEPRRRASRTASPGNDVGRQCPSLSERMCVCPIAAARRVHAAAGFGSSSKTAISFAASPPRRNVWYAEKPASPPPTMATRVTSPSPPEALRRSSAGTRRTPRAERPSRGRPQVRSARCSRRTAEAARRSRP